MEITLIAIGKTDHHELQTLIDEYKKRLGYYIKFQFEILPDIKNSKHLSEAQQKEKEGELLLKKTQPSDVIFLLDENGKSFTSVDFSSFFTGSPADRISYLTVTWPIKNKGAN